MRKRYSEFLNKIDVDRVFATMGIEFTEERDEEQIAHCPDFWSNHKNGDQTGKFAWHPDKLVYNCWVCGGGNLLTLAMGYLDTDVEGATDWLFTFTKRKHSSDVEFLSAVNDALGVLRTPARGSKARTMPYFNAAVLDKWVGNDHLWFEARGISMEVRSEYRLGYDAEAIRYAPKKDGQSIADPHVGEAIILPHYWKGKLVGWQSRWLGDRPKWLPKYTNTHDFPRQETLYGYDHAVRQEFPVMVVESVPTVLFLQSVGLPAVATFGASITDPQMKLLRRLQQGIVLAADNDAAGKVWQNKLVSYLDRYVPLQVAPLVGSPGSGGDLGDLAPDRDALWEHLEGTRFLGPAFE